MADGQGTTQNKSSGSIGASQPEFERPPLLVSPSVLDEFNTIRSNLIPNACFSLEDSHFEFDSSFVFPMGLTFDAGPLKNLLDKHPGFKLSIFGHTDPAGKDDYNKILSGRRAQAVFGLLVRDVKLWEDLYFHHDTQGRDKWGVKAVQAMLNFAGPTKAGTVDGKLGTNTRNALKDFESAQNLPLKGFNAKEEIDPGTFRVLAPLYMDAICLDDDGNKFQLTPDDFIARGAGKDGKGDFQGCGEFNPLMMFSKAEKTFFDKEVNKKERNKENQQNRRIMILLYRPGTRVDPAKWPCPSVKEGVAGCILRFHSNFKDRRSNLDEKREHKNESNNPGMVGTFACRFYDRQTNGSPCERPIPVPTLVKLRIDLQDEKGVALANKAYSLEVDGILVSKPGQTTDASGHLEHDIPPDAKKGVIKTDVHIWNLQIENLIPASENKGAQVRLTNLGFFFSDFTGELDEDTQFALRTFQDLLDLDVSGDLDEPTQRKLVELHRS